jgi:hypothetical protein
VEGSKSLGHDVQGLREGEVREGDGRMVRERKRKR